MKEILAICLIFASSLTSALSLWRETGNGNLVEHSSQLLLEVKRLLKDLKSEQDDCASVLRKCVTTGEIFKRNYVCANNMKRYLNSCHLQLRSCDLKRETGEVLTEERCLWILVNDQSNESRNNSDESGNGSAESGNGSGESERSSDESNDDSNESRNKSDESGGGSEKSGKRSRESERSSDESNDNSDESGSLEESENSSNESKKKSDESKGKSRSSERKPK